MLTHIRLYLWRVHRKSNGCILIPVFLTLTYALQLVIDKNLATLPRRKTDNAIIIRSQDSDVAKARVFKLNAVSGEPILLERYEHVSFICSDPLTSGQTRRT